MTNGKPIKILRVEFNGEVIPSYTQVGHLKDDELIEEMAQALKIEDYERCAKLKEEARRRGLEVCNDDIAETRVDKYIGKCWSISISGDDISYK